MSLLAGPPYSPGELAAIADFATEMTRRSSRLQVVIEKLARNLAADLEWEGKAADGFTTLLSAQIDKLKLAQAGASKARNAAQAGLAEAQRINREWVAAVREYEQAMKEQG